MNVGIYNNVIKNVDSYKKDILKKGFEDILLGEDTFKNVQARGRDELVDFLLIKYPNYSPDLNFARRSPIYQDEPNYIHTDEMMGDLTAILYLYYKGKKSCILKAKYNRLVVFPSDLYHSRNIFDNYGSAENARLIQVCFLKENK